MFKKDTIQQIYISHLPSFFLSIISRQSSCWSKPSDEAHLLESFSLSFQSDMESDVCFDPVHATTFRAVNAPFGRIKPRAHRTTKVRRKLWGDCLVLFTIIICFPILLLPLQCANSSTLCPMDTNNSLVLGLSVEGEQFHFRISDDDDNEKGKKEEGKKSLVDDDVSSIGNL